MIEKISTPRKETHMKRKLLITTLLSMSLLSFNVSAGNKVKCTGTHCFVDLSGLSAPKVKAEPQQKPSVEDKYATVILDNIETIIFTKYVMTNEEAAEYELENSLEELLKPSLTKESLPISERFCEKNLKLVKVAGIPNTFECA
ncbi:MAG: Unknown protein [uncultured Sulfurovum sp.]|uniref:Uncharacterized protein n=1 Tax=uncultured Sulfurovum sp. TaxID=269237 RepID=A0A6S6TGA3_9BACT|nr:MAG: Unknown protein [uncultured Sulfurovum sp.]